MPPVWLIWGIVANVAIAVVEARNRTAPSFGAALMITLPFIAIAQYGLFRSWNGASSLLLAWSAFTAGNLVLRLISVTWVVGEPPSMMMLAGVSLVMAGVFVVKGAS